MIQYIKNIPALDTQLNTEIGCPSANEQERCFDRDKHEFILT